MADLAKLVVKLEAQTAQYQANLEKAQRHLARFDRASAISVKRIGAGLATAAAAAATAFGAMAKSAIDSADHISKLAQSTGISTESLSQLQYAAGLSGTSMEDLEKSIRRLQKTSYDAAQGLSTAKRAFETLGISSQNADGSLKDTESLLLEVADRFAKLEDGAAKAALAQELFGRSGAALIPFLNEGRAGIEALKREADAFGLTITDKAGKAAELFNDNLERLQAASRGLVNQFLQQALPTLSAMSERFVQSAKNGGALEVAVKALAVAFKALVTAGVIVTSVFEQLGQVIYGVGAAVFRLAHGDFKLAAEEISDAFAKARGNVTDDMETIAQVWSDALPEVAAAAAGADAALKETLLFNPEKATKAAKDTAKAALEQLREMALRLQQQVATFGEGEAAVMRYRLAHGDLAETLREAGEAAQPYAEQLVALTAQLTQLQEKAEADQERQQQWNAAVEEGRRITEAMRTPLEIYQQEIEKLNEALQLGVISQETYNRAVEQAQETLDKVKKKGSEFLEQASRNVQDIMAEFLEDPFSKGLDGMVADFGRMLQRMAAQAIAADIAAKIFGSGGVGSGGGWLNSIMSLFGGSRDSGGRGEPGRSYLIGTGAQPEMFIPDTPGRFIPATQMGGMTVQQNFTIQAPAGTVSRYTQQQIAATASRGLAEANRRNN